MTDTRGVGFVGERGDGAARTGIRASLADQLNDPDSPLVRDAKSRRCDQCHAKPGQPCTPRGGFRDDLKGRLIHLGRQEKP